MMQNNLPVGIFDSGVGGLTVFKAIHNLLPHENIIYLGDTARLPYGTKSKDTIIRYTFNAASHLIERGVKLLVIACNTATSAALPYLEEKFKPIPVIGVIKPGAEAAVETSKNGRIAVIATEATIKGDAYPLAIKSIWPNAKIISKACTLFVSLAEEGWTDGPVAEEAIKKYLGDTFINNINSISKPDTLLLGCTHFPLLKNSLNKIIGSDVKIVDSALATAKCVKSTLAKYSLFTSGIHNKQTFLITDNPERFAKIGNHFLGTNINVDEIELINL